MATRWRCPPESAFGLRSKYGSRSNNFAASLTRRARSSFATPAIFSAKPMFSATVMCGYSAYDWKTIAMSRSFGATLVTSRSPIKIAPLSISSNPASMRSDVDFPQPDGPTKTKNSPSLTVRFNLFTAGAVVPG